MQKAKLLKLAKFLRTKVPVKKFDMTEWLRVDIQPLKDWDAIYEIAQSDSVRTLASTMMDKLDKTLGEVEKIGPVNVKQLLAECGTTACVAGWATVCFPRSNLFLSSDGDGFFTVRYNGDEGIEALASMFGISWSDASYLFYGDYGGNTPKQVALHIEQFVENDGNY